MRRWSPQSRMRHISLASLVLLTGALLVLSGSLIAPTTNAAVVVPQLPDLFKQYDAALQQGKCRKALQVAEKAHDLDPDDDKIDAMIYMAKVQMYVEEAKRGKRIPDGLFAVEPNSVEAPNPRDPEP